MITVALEVALRDDVRLDDNDVQMDENGPLRDDIDATIAMCNALSDNRDVQCEASVAMGQS